MKSKQLNYWVEKEWNQTTEKKMKSNENEAN